MNQYQLQHINSVVNDLKSKSLHRDSKIDMLESTVNFNSRTIDKLQRMQKEVVGIIESSYKGLKSNLNEISLELRDLRINFAALSASMGYFNLEKLVYNLMYELKSIFKGKFDSKILTPELKNEMYRKIQNAGFNLLGEFDFMENMIKVKYIYIDNKITILLNIPVESHRRINVFKLYKLFSLPIKVNNKFLKL